MTGTYKEVTRRRISPSFAAFNFVVELSVFSPQHGIIFQNFRVSYEYFFLNLVVFYTVLFVDQKQLLNGAKKDVDCTVKGALVLFWLRKVVSPNAARGNLHFEMKLHLLTSTPSLDCLI